MLCEYRDAAGRPGEGVHRFRIGGVAAVDLGLTLLAAWVVSRVFRVALWKAVLGLLLLGVVVHRVFCVNTALNRKLFGAV